MWIRLRLDISWNDLIAAILFCVLPTSRKKRLDQATKKWSPNDDCIITLSVRSAFDLILRALQLPKGSEILMTALTVPGMIRIVEAHGLIPVPVDIDCNGKIIKSSLLNAISIKSRLIIIAHLFGNQSELEEIIPLLKQNDILIAEDCAQSFERVGEKGNDASDFVLHSFGPIKTCTALGGAIARVNSPRHLSTMKSIFKNDLVSTRIKFLLRVFKFTVLKISSGQITFLVLKKIFDLCRIDYDLFLNKLGQSFSSENLIPQIRQQPSTPLVRLINRRWSNYNFDRIEERKRMGKKFDLILKQTRPKHSNYWIYPIYSTDKEQLCDALRDSAFDATTLSRMAIVKTPADRENLIPIETLKSWNNVVFIPWYPELTDRALETMGKVITTSRIASEP